MTSSSPQSSPHELRSAMSALLTEFTSRMDCGEAIDDLLHENASLHTPRGEIRGRAEIGKLFTNLFESRRRSGQVSRHSSLDVRARVISPNLIEVRSILIAFSMSGVKGEGGSLLVGDQVDMVELGADGAYRILERKLSPALEFDLTKKQKAGH
jgi:hypothetical protein